MIQELIDTNKEYMDQGLTNELVIETDQWVTPKEKGLSDDARELSLRLEDMSWGSS